MIKRTDETGKNSSMTEGREGLCLGKDYLLFCDIK